VTVRVKNPVLSLDPVQVTVSDLKKLKLQRGFETGHRSLGVNAVRIVGMPSKESVTSLIRKKSSSLFRVVFGVVMKELAASVWLPKKGVTNIIPGLSSRLLHRRSGRKYGAPESTGSSARTIKAMKAGRCALEAKPAAMV